MKLMNIGSRGLIQGNSERHGLTEKIEIKGCD